MGNRLLFLLLGGFSYEEDFFIGMLILDDYISGWSWDGFFVILGENGPGSN